MYESFYSFSARPFLAVPVTNRYFPATSIESARQNLVRCIERVEGCGLVMGPPGSGISLLCEVIAEHFGGQIDTVLLASLRLTNCREMLQAILYKIGIPYLRLTDGELRLAIMDALSSEGSCPQGILLIVDEAHLLSPRLFEELRFMTNMVREANPGVRLLMAGGSAIEERFAHPRLSQINQRVAVRCYLHPYTAEESFQYVRAQTAAAGTNPDRLWAMDALKAIHRYADGCPRLINQLCDHALRLAAEAKVPQLGEPEIELAWSDFQQLPTGTATSQSSSETPESGSQVIEFASLDDEANDATQNQPPSTEVLTETVDNMDSAPSEAEMPTVPEIHEAISSKSMDTELNHTIVCQNQMPIETALDHKQHEAVFNPDEPPSEKPPCTLQEHTPDGTGMSITDFVGIDAHNVVQLHSNEHASPEQPETVSTEQDKIVETKGEEETGTPIWMVHREAHAAKEAQQLTSSPDSPEPAPSTTLGKPHPLIPIQPQVISELISELQETHLSE